MTLPPLVYNLYCYILLVFFVSTYKPVSYVISHPQSLAMQFVNWMFLVNFMRRKHIRLNFRRLKCCTRHTTEQTCGLGKSCCVKKVGD